MSTIKKIAAAKNRVYRDNYYQETLKAQASGITERAPSYSVKRVEFNPISRNAKIEIHQVQQYKKIIKYIQRDYVKTPIYSGWLSKEKTISKSIKLTNSELEGLNNHFDPIIKMLAEDIIIALNNAELFPSWFIKTYLRRELNEDLRTYQKELGYYTERQKSEIQQQKNRIAGYKNDKLPTLKILSKQQKKKEKLFAKITKLESLKPSAIKNIFSLGIYAYLRSQARKNALNSMLEKVNTAIDESDKIIAGVNQKIEACNNAIKTCNSNIRKKQKEYEDKKAARTLEYDKQYAEVTPLSTTIAHDDSFQMLKSFGGLTYEKIIGVYIIHNLEKDKYYVGQSKDIMKRIKQHFNGTIPKNPIFAEDYYTSQMENKEDIFEVKIIPCETKDELDKLEKELISKYDSWLNGYNGTSGNM